MKIKRIYKTNLTEQCLEEATFSGKNHLQTHYDRHVLKQNEKFDYNDPKFPYMTIDEYAKRAEDLSNTKAGASDSDESVIGYVSNNDNWRFPRLIKIKRKSELNAEMSEVVIYVDDEVAGNQIMSYMLIRPDKALRRMKRDKINELPENQ